MAINLKEKILNDLKPIIQNWDEKDIYAISFFVYDDEDNPSKPTLTVGYNTLSFYNQCVKDVEDEIEAKWNYAIWPQNEEYSLGFESETEAFIAQWVTEQNFNCMKKDKTLPNSCLDDTGLEITRAFVKELQEVVTELHESGFIANKFGQPIPILIHELEYYDEIVDQNIACNGKELVSEFVAFVEGF